MAPNGRKQTVQGAATTAAEPQNETASTATSLSSISGNKRSSGSRPATTKSNENSSNKRRKVAATASVSNRRLYDKLCRELTYYRWCPSKILQLIEEGGRDVVLHKNYKGVIPLHVALKHCEGAPIEVVIEVLSKLIEVGGSKSVLVRSYTWNSLHHYLCNSRYNNNHRVSTDVLDLLANHGGKKLFTHRNNKNRTAVQEILSTDSKCCNAEQKASLIEDAALVIDRGIQQLQHTEQKYEYALGGLFDPSSTDQGKEEIFFSHWDVVLPSLERLMALRPQNCQLPLLQSFIVNKVPPDMIGRVFKSFEEQYKPWDLERMDFRNETSMENLAENLIQEQTSIMNEKSQRIIKDIVNHFPESVHIRDSLNQYPVDVAVKYELSWNDGMKEIVEAFASTKKSSSALIVCAKHGVEWEDGTATVVEEAGTNQVRRVDESTGLYPFMLAGVGGQYHCDFDSVFHLIKASPEVVQKYDVKNDEEE